MKKTGILLALLYLSIIDILVFNVFKEKCESQITF